MEADSSLHKFVRSANRAHRKFLRSARTAVGPEERKFACESGVHQIAQSYKGTGTDSTISRSTDSVASDFFCREA